MGAKQGLLLERHKLVLIRIYDLDGVVHHCKSYISQRAEQCARELTEIQQALHQNGDL